MKKFWLTSTLKQHYSNNVALVAYCQSENDFIELTYSQLATKVKLAKQLIDNSCKQLIVIKSSITIETVVFYLAALELHYTVWFIDEVQSTQEILDSCQYYQANYLVDNGQVTHLNSQKTELLDELALLNTTSGSTGSKKLVKISFSNLQVNCASICQCLPIESSDVVITTLPFHYSFGLSILNSHLSSGSTIILNKHAVITREFWQYFSQYKVTSFYGVPYLFEMLLKLKLTRLKLESLRYFAVAGGKLLPDSVKKVADWCHQQSKQFFVMYGQTEATARISYLKSEKVKCKPNSIGQAITGGRMWLEDKTNKIVEESNQTGELCFQGPNVMIGTAQSIDDLTLPQKTDILRTGDLAFKDSEGDFYITGRLTRFIKIQSHRINLDEVEAILLQNNIKAYCLGNDEQLHCCIVQKRAERSAQDNEIGMLSKLLNIHSSYISKHYITQVPLLSSGKVDYQSLNKSIAVEVASS